MQLTSSTQTIITNVVMFVKLNENNGMKTTQRMAFHHLKGLYNTNPLMFGTSTWVSVAGTFRSMISKSKNNTNSTKGMEKYIKVKEIKGANVLSLKKTKTTNAR